MTIAACYVSPEGIVLGADSTTTYANSGVNHYFNNAQKLFEIGCNSNFGAVTWGLGGLGVSSYRKLLAILADDLSKNPPSSVKDVAERWIEQFWLSYTDVFSEVIKNYGDLAQKSKYVKDGPQEEGMRTEEEEAKFIAIPQDRYVGFCIGGYVECDRAPAAYTVHFDLTNAKPSPDELTPGPYLWGAPNLVIRQIRGYDPGIREDLLTCGKWQGTPEDLDEILGQYGIGHSYTVPIREAIDFVHSCVFSTIKALKFSSFSQICGGSIEIAAITADRPFRWVRHKNLGQALNEGGV